MLLLKERQSRNYQVLLSSTQGKDRDVVGTITQREYEVVFCSRKLEQSLLRTRSSWKLLSSNTRLFAVNPFRFDV